MNLYGQDMDETTSPLESGLGWTVDLKTDREFVGRQALLEKPVTKQLIGLVLSIVAYCAATRKLPFRITKVKGR